MDRDGKAARTADVGLPEAALDRHGYVWALWPPDRDIDPSVYRPGDEVFVHTRSATDDGWATVTQPVIEDEAHRYSGRIRVQFHAQNNPTAHVRPARITPCLPKLAKRACAPTAADDADGAVAGLLVSCPETEHFRLLARTQVTPADFAVDIGSSYGRTTVLLHRKCARAIGIEISKDLIEESQKQYPQIDFRRLDAIGDKPAVADAARGCTVAFIDVGGDRALPALTDVIPFVQSVLKPRLIVVKSRELHRAALDQHARPRDAAPRADGLDGVFRELVVPGSNAWWDGVCKAEGAGKMNVLSRRALVHPLKAPQRTSRAGVLICRFHNYDTCFKKDKPPEDGGCPRDHEHCHRCLAKGHTAKECTSEYGVTQTIGDSAR
ncbi:unnamed protein product [Pedinophyceae sp. YPF-701]|nr:unnamed protein product [Pedinophyceae sp. YPF-701]